MGEEERRRKIIIDSARAMVRATGCMEATLYLSRMSTHTTDAQVDAFRAACEAVAVQAAEIQRHCEGEGG